jgi:toxin ParE1/3/4
MPEAIFAPAALRDLIEIHDFIACESPQAACRLLQRFEEKAGHLAASPAIGRPRHELHPGYRSFAIGSYVIFYQPIENGIEIVRVLHGRRDIDTIFVGDD